MPGTYQGGLNARDTNIRRHGKDFYRQIGLKGVEAYRQQQKDGIAKPRGFAANKEAASRAGKIGGRKSKRHV